MDKNRSHFLARFRGLIQAGAALLTNIHLPNFLKGTLYQGKGKYLCVPGLNCYSCPGAAGACPIGAFQAVVGSSKFRFSYYVTGILILLGVLLGRFICGFRRLVDSLGEGILCKSSCSQPNGQRKPQIKRPSSTPSRIKKEDRNVEQKGNRSGAFSAGCRYDDRLRGMAPIGQAPAAPGQE